MLTCFVTRPAASHSALQDSPCRKPRAQRIAYDPCPHGRGRSSARRAGTSRRIDLLILLLCAKDIARRCSCQRAASGWAGRFEHANTSRPRGNTRTIHARREGREYLAAVIRVIGFVLRTGHRMAGQLPGGGVRPGGGIRARGERGVVVGSCAAARSSERAWPDLSCSRIQAVASLDSVSQFVPTLVAPPRLAEPPPKFCLCPRTLWNKRMQQRLHPRRWLDLVLRLGITSVIDPLHLCPANICPAPKFKRGRR